MNIESMNAELHPILQYFLLAVVILSFAYAIYQIIVTKRKREKKGSPLNPENSERYPYNQPIIILTVENTSDSEQKVSLFGCNRNLQQMNYGCGPGVNIKSSMGDSSYSELLLDSAHYPFVVAKTRLHSTNLTQLIEPLNYFARSSGSSAMILFDIKKCVEEMDKNGRLQKTLADLDIVYDIDARRSLDFNIHPNATVTFTFWLKSRFNGLYKLSEAIKNK